MKKEKLEYIAYLIIVIAGAIAAAFIFFRYVFLSVLPFFIGWFIAFASDASSEKLTEKIKMPKRVLRLSIFALITLLALISIFLLCRAVFGELWGLLRGLGENGRFFEILDALTEQMLGIFGKMNFSDEIEKSIIDAFSQVATTLLGSLGSAISSLAGMIPRILLFVVITIISGVYFSLDLENINSAVRGFLPRKVFSFLTLAKNGALSVAKRYLRSYFLIMLMTFCVMFLGFLLLRVEYAFLFALIVSALDVLPVIGVGTVLVPASVFCFASGNRQLALGLLILFCVNEIIRQLAEPKIIGKHLGIHPILTLATMYIGYSLFGFAAFFLLPIIVVMLGMFGDKNNSAKVQEPAVVKRN